MFMAILKKKLVKICKRIPQNKYGYSKKNVEDYIIKNRKNLNFKIGIARLFNITGKIKEKVFL